MAHGLRGVGQRARRHHAVHRHQHLPRRHRAAGHGSRAVSRGKRAVPIPCPEPSRRPVARRAPGPVRA
jgi:hypothetical protein